MSEKTADVVIIGGGVIGCAIAFYLSRQKVKVVLLEKRGLCSGTSGACDGTVFMQTKKPGVHLQLAMQSRRRFNWLQERLPLDIELETEGGIVIAESADELEALRRHVEEQRGAGLDVRLLDTALAREIEPNLAETILGAAYSPLDAQVNPLRLTLGFAEAARDLGADIRPHSPVVSVDTISGRIIAVQTKREKISTPVVVNAAGTFAPRIARMVGLEVPIEPRRGQLLVTESAPRLIRRVAISGRYILAKYDPDLAARKGEGLSMEQTASGNLLLGATREFVGFDTSTTIEKLHRIAGQAIRVLPALKNMKAIRAFAGLRPYTPDGYPFVGSVPQVEGFMMAAGHEGDGIAFAPLMGEIISQLIAGEKPALDIDEMKASRLARWEGRKRNE
jgi:sarcosine oxidase subunit beta